MPRPKRPPHIKATKESFSAPAYVALAAKLAAGWPHKDVAPWIVAAITEKLRRENPGLLEEAHEKLRTEYVEPDEKQAAIAAEDADVRGLLARAAAKPDTPPPLGRTNSPRPSATKR